jgi:hypothetical protein
MALYEKRRMRELRSYAFVATAAAIDSNIFIADKPCILKEVKFVVTIAAASATLDLKKCTGTTVPASGTTMLSSTIALDTTINTVTTKNLTTTAANLVLQPGDRIAADLSGTLTGLSAVVQYVIETI